MKHRKSLAAIIISMALLGIVTYTAVTAQSSTSYSAHWNVIGSGGSRASSDSFVTNGTFGQSAASPPISSSASYIVTSGYWSGINDAPLRLYLPQLSR